MTTARELVRGRFVDPAFRRQLAGIGGMRREGIRLAMRHEARCFDRLLRVHTEEFHIEQNLDVCLCLVIAAGRTEWHDHLAGPDRKRRVRCEARAFTGSERRGVASYGPALRATGGGRKPCARDDRRFEGHVRWVRRERVAILVDNADIGGIRWRGRRAFADGTHAR